MVRYLAELFHRLPGTSAAARAMKAADLVIPHPRGWELAEVLHKHDARFREFLLLVEN